MKAIDAYGNVVVRLNTVDGGSTDIEINGPWEYPDNDASDIAAIPFDLWGRMLSLGVEVDTLPIPLRWFVTPEIIASDQIGVGDELVIVGLFRRHIGTERNLPIVRGGIIAAMPTEPLVDPHSDLGYDAYLAEFDQ